VATLLRLFDLPGDFGDLLGQRTKKLSGLGRPRIIDHLRIVSPILNVRALGRDAGTYATGLTVGVRARILSAWLT
jgi:hypothetical protein